MNIISSIILFLVVWFLSLFIILPLRLTSQNETGDVVRGTPASAPTNPQLKKKFLVVTVVAVVVWTGIVLFLMSGIMTIRDLDFFNRMAPIN